MIVGRFLGVNALAAVGATGTIAFLIFGWINGITGGFGIMLAQSFGAGDEKHLRHYTAMSVYLCTAMAVLMAGGLLLANGWILKAMNTPDSIFEDTKSYIGIVYAGIPITIAYNMLASISRSMGDSRTPLIFLVISSVLNIVLDLVFVAVLPMGVEGAAYATVLAQAVSAAACFFYVRKKYEILHLKKEDMKFSWNSAGRLMMMGLPMGLQFSIESAGSYLYCSIFGMWKNHEYCDTAFPVSWNYAGQLCWPEHGSRKSGSDTKRGAAGADHYHCRGRCLRAGHVFLGRCCYEIFCR